MKKVLKSLLISVAFASTATASNSETFGGIGVSVWTSESGINVAGVLPNSPAQSIGLQAGDLILSANGTELSSIETSKQINYLRGEAGSVANLVVERNGEKITLSAKRVSISVQNLDASEISAWYGKSNGLTSEEISHLASQKTGEGYELLGVMQNGMPLSGAVENANAMQQVSAKKAEEAELPEAKPVRKEAVGNATVNAKGAHVKKQNVTLFKTLK